MPRRVFLCCSALAIFLIVSAPARAANGATDSDGDGLGDNDEAQVYHTDPLRADTDGDGFADGAEVAAGYSPLVAGKKLTEVDTDGDGLSDALELAFGTDLGRADSDGDGFADGVEVTNGYDPRDPSPKKLEKSIAIHTKSQKLSYSLGGVKLGEFAVSTGKKKTPTPTGEFTISKKSPKTWSRRAGLWMPWWMNFTGPRAPAGLYAIHELPIWPNGKREGTAHLGIPVSGGCVRLGIGPAKFLYDWAPPGTSVIVTAD